jgi:hypothetical protein
MQIRRGDKPDLLNATITAIAQFSERKDAYARLGRNEELMEVSVIASANAPPLISPAGNPSTQALDLLCCTAVYESGQAGGYTECQGQA